MKESVELRVAEEHVASVFGPAEGRSLGSVRRVVIAADDPRSSRIGALQRRLLARNDYFFAGWRIRRTYTQQELAAATLFHLIFAAVFEPAGEQCGTVYDETAGCPRCRAGRRQVSALRLDLRKVPRGKDLARTIADEWICSQRAAETVVRERLGGFELRLVEHKAVRAYDPVDLGSVPAGRRLLARATRAGIDPGSWEFVVWLNSPEQSRDCQQAHFEHRRQEEAAEARRGVAPPAWYQIIPTSRPLTIVAPTRCGVDPFDGESPELHVCPNGDTIGLNLLSEVSVSGGLPTGIDIAATGQYVGVRSGVLIPAPLLLVSQRFREVLESNGLRGYRTEVAHVEGSVP